MVFYQKQWFLPRNQWFLPESVVISRVFGQKVVILPKEWFFAKKSGFGGPGKGVWWPGEQYSQTRHVEVCRIYAGSGFLQHPKGVIFVIFAILPGLLTLRRAVCGVPGVVYGVVPVVEVPGVVGTGYGADPTPTPWYGSGYAPLHCFPLYPTVTPLWSPWTPLYPHCDSTVVSLDSTVAVLALLVPL